MIIGLLFLIAQISKLRNNYQLPKITYNNDIHEILIAFRDTRGPQWFHENSTYWVLDPNVVPLTYENKTVLSMKYHTIQNGKTILNGVEDWHYLFHDTNNGDIQRTLRYRIGQRKCFNFQKSLIFSGCSNQFDYYASCLVDPPVIIPGKKCTWAWFYLPKLLIRSLSEIACIELDAKGPYAPRIQLKSFFCYGKHNKEISDNPFDN